MKPFWTKIRAMKPWLDTGYDDVPEKEFLVSPERDRTDPEGGALHHVRLLRLRVQLDGVRPRVLRAGGARQGLPLRRRPARPDGGRAARALQRRARDLGLHPVLLLQRALPQGRRPARRDRQARRRVDPARHRPRHGREAREVVRPPRRRRRAGCARPSSSRRPRASSARSRRRSSRSTSPKHGKVPPPFPPHVADGRRRRRARSTTS